MNIRSGLPMHVRQNEKTISVFRNKRLTLQLLRGSSVFSAAASRRKSDG